MHIHTSPVSPCGDFSPVEVIDKHIALGYHGVVITNHFQPRLVDKFENHKDFVEYFLNDYREAKEYGDTTKIIIAQRVSSIKSCTKILMLDDGKILGYGTHDELMQKCGEYREIALLQMEEVE